MSAYGRYRDWRDRRRRGRFGGSYTVGPFTQVHTFNPGVADSYVRDADDKAGKAARRAELEAYAASFEPPRDDARGGFAADLAGIARTAAESARTVTAAADVRSAR